MTKWTVEVHLLFFVTRYWQNYEEWSFGECVGFQALDKMENEWAPVSFEILPYKETNTYILKASEDISQLLDDHIVMTQSMSFSPYKKPFEDRISTWESKLRTTQV